MIKAKKESYYSRKFPTELKVWKHKIEEASRIIGFPVPPIIYEVITAKEMAGLQAYHGLPSRFSHWSHGMHYDKHLKELSWHGGNALAMEMVCSNQPFIGYLQEGNSLVTQKTVMAHAGGHGFFMSNNFWAKSCHSEFIDEFSNHSARIAYYIQKHGLEQVERFLDACLSIDSLIDINKDFLKRKVEKKIEEKEESVQEPGKIPTKSYLDAYINPKEYIKAQEEEIKKKVQEQKESLFIEPEKDIMLFLLKHGQMASWEKDILSMIREEAYYFVPIGRTKTINEGSAVFLEHLIMTGSDATNPYKNQLYPDGVIPLPILEPNELVEYADQVSRVMANYGYNPYRVGVSILRDIEDRWNKGKFGKEWEECENFYQRKNWDKKFGLGRQKVKEVMLLCNDISLIDEYLTQELVDDLKLFVWKRNEKQVKIKSRKLEEVKKALLYQMMNMGYPTVEITEVKKNGDLHLTHNHDGVNLDQSRTRSVLERIASSFWRRGDVCINTSVGKGKEIWFVKQK